MTTNELLELIYQWNTDEIEVEKISDTECNEFYEAVIKLLGEKGYGSAIDIPCGGTDEDLIFALFTKIEQARSNLDAEDFNKFWKCFKFTNDIIIAIVRPATSSLTILLRFSK